MLVELLLWICADVVSIFQFSVQFRKPLSKEYRREIVLSKTFTIRDQCMQNDNMFCTLFYFEIMFGKIVFMFVLIVLWG